MEETEKKSKIIKVRVRESLFDLLQKEAQFEKMSLSGYINFVMNKFIKKSKILYDETSKIHEKKDTRIRVSLTSSETDVLSQHALENGWSLIQEVRYRLMSSLSKKPKFNQEELKAIYAVRSCINVLGTNINRLVRDSQPLSDDNIHICQELMIHLKDLKDKISHLEKCGSSNFKLKVKGRVDGRSG